MGDYTTYRVGTRKKVSRVPCGRPKPKKLSKERVYELVRAEILRRKAEIERKGGCWEIVTVEELASLLDVETHKVIQALHELNLRRIVEQKERRFAENTTRNKMFPGRDIGWAANVYNIVFNLPVWRGSVISPKPTKYPEGTIPVWDEKEPSKRRKFSKRLGYRPYR